MTDNQELQRIADAHADWLDTLLCRLPDAELNRNFVCWVYRTAFVHGGKHALELQAKAEKE